MRTDRRYLLDLVASGRISAAQAERLMAAWSADRETLWALAACAVLAGAAYAPAWMHLFHSLGSAWLPAVRHAVTFITVLLGGMS